MHYCKNEGKWESRSGHDMTPKFQWVQSSSEGPKSESQQAKIDTGIRIGAKTETRYLKKFLAPVSSDVWFRKRPRELEIEISLEKFLVLVLVRCLILTQARKVEVGIKTKIGTCIFKGVRW